MSTTVCFGVRLSSGTKVPWRSNPQYFFHSGLWDWWRQRYGTKCPYDEEKVGYDDDWPWVVLYVKSTAQVYYQDAIAQLRVNVPSEAERLGLEGFLIEHDIEADKPWFWVIVN